MKQLTLLAIMVVCGLLWLAWNQSKESAIHDCEAKAYVETLRCKGAVMQIVQRGDYYEYTCVVYGGAR